MLNWLFE
jgi:hypothetical protein